MNLINPLRIKNVDLIHLPENRLRFKFRATTNRDCDAVIKYWTENSKDTLYTDVSKGTSHHTLWIVNTTAPTNYNFQIIAFNNKQKALSKERSFKTMPIYHATPYFNLEYIDNAFKKEINNKFFLTQILTEPGSAVIIDDFGNIVWYEAFKKGVKVSHWTTEKTVLCILGAEKIPSSGGDEIIEIDLSGKVKNHLQVGKGDMDKMVHHEVRKDEQGNIYAITFDEKIFDLSSIGGSKQDTVHGDGIVVFNKDGHKIWEWSMLDHLDPLSDPEIMKRKKDWVHANSVFKQKDGNFLLSFRDLNQIWNIDYKTGRVIWKFGDKGNFEFAPSDHFSSQHSAHITQNNELMILDNGTKNGITRALAFQLDTTNQKAYTKLKISLPREYYTTVKGNVSLFNIDKVLFCVTDPRALFVTDMKGRILWKIQVDGDPYRVEEIHNFLYPKPDFDASRN
ncbi:aryl-sulfate sulfotransferase [Pseudopedobacter beijingensis]